MSYQIEFKHLILVEGGYANNPGDPGGKTRYGITEAVARRNGYTGQMDQLPLDVARKIYKAEYWDKLNLDIIEPLVPHVAHEMFDCGVNMGVGVAGKFLQTALKVFSDNGNQYPEISVDGDVGKETVGAIHDYMRAYRRYPAETVLMRAFVCQRGADYLRIAHDNPKESRFEFGWFNKRVEMMN